MESLYSGMEILSRIVLRFALNSYQYPWMAGTNLNSCKMTADLIERVSFWFVVRLFIESGTTLQWVISSKWLIDNLPFICNAIVSDSISKDDSCYSTFA